MPVKVKVFEYAVTLHEDGRASAEDHDPIAFGGEWSPEHLVLAGLAKCSLTSLRHFARHGRSVADGAVATTGTVTRRDDGSYGFVDIECALDVTVEPEPDDLGELIAKAEWGCFVGSSLLPKPRYSWRVNGKDVR